MHFQPFKGLSQFLWGSRCPPPLGYNMNTTHFSLAPSMHSTPFVQWGAFPSQLYASQHCREGRGPLSVPIAPVGEGCSELLSVSLPQILITQQTSSTYSEVTQITQGWRMVPRKSWVSEKFSPTSESRQCFYRLSKAHFFLVWFRNPVSLWLGFSNKCLGISASLGFYHSPLLQIYSPKPCLMFSGY